MQVLPYDDCGEAWPRLMGRLAFTLFGGNRPAIRHLQIEAIHDRIPDDLLECWATALWAVQACVAATAAHKRLRQNMGTILATLVQQTYARTGLRKDELESGRIGAVFERLNARFAGRLGLDPALIGTTHARAIVDLFTPALSA